MSVFFQLPVNLKSGLFATENKQKFYARATVIIKFCYYLHISCI